MAPFDSKYMIFYLMTMVMFSQSVRIRDIRETNKKISFTLEKKMKVEVEEENNGTCVVRMEMFDST